MGILHIVLPLAITASSVLASEQLPIEGNYGNAAGCQALAETGWQDNEIHLTPAEYGGHEWSCSFKWISAPETGTSYPGAGGAPRPEKTWLVLSLCFAEGSATPGLFTLTVDDETATVSQDKDDVDDVVLNRC